LARSPSICTTERSGFTSARAFTAVRRKIGASQKEAEIVAAQTNLQLAQGAPMAFSFQALSVAELRQRFLDYHEHVMKSSVGTLSAGPVTPLSFSVHYFTIH
jgi:hypothetical protein